MTWILSRHPTPPATSVPKSWLISIRASLITTQVCIQTVNSIPIEMWVRHGKKMRGSERIHSPPVDHPFALQWFPSKILSIRTTGLLGHSSLPPSASR